MIFAGHLFCVCWQHGSSFRIRIVIRNGLPDPNSDVDHHQNVISWSLGHTPALRKISSKPVGNLFFDNPVNADFGLRTSGSGQWSGSSPKLNSLVSGPCPTLQEISSKSVHNFFSYARTDRQTNRQTRTEAKTTSFGGGNYSTLGGGKIPLLQNVCKMLSIQKKYFFIIWKYLGARAQRPRAYLGALAPVPCPPPLWRWKKLY